MYEQKEGNLRRLEVKGTARDLGFECGISRRKYSQIQADASPICNLFVLSFLFLSSRLEELFCLRS
jgi:hypothetical protein